MKRIKESRGLGDTIDKFTTATGVKSFTQFLNRNYLNKFDYYKCILIIYTMVL